MRGRSRRWPSIAAAVLIALPVLGLPACALMAQAPAASPHVRAPYAQRLDVAKLTALGREMFFDASLSASGRVSCASCHDPAHAYGPSNALSVQPGGGANGETGGFRAAPSLRYLQSVPAFDEHHFDNDGDDSVDMGPTGGRTWDGRAASAHEQARLPLLSPDEMGNASALAVVEKIRAAPYAAQFTSAFGADVFDRADDAFDAALMALEVFQQSPTDFYPYSSRYDAVLRGQATLTPREARGLALFEDPAKGNCASCHLSKPTPDGAFPLFSDFGHIAIGVPRNRTTAANADPRFFDLGLCGPLRTDFADEADYCGRFRTPSLRNAAVRQSFFHNGGMHTLDEAIRFYVQRDTDPAHWYGRNPDGSPRRFDDLPERFHANVNTDPPFGGRPGDAPALSDAEIDDVVAFLKTLTDADQTNARPNAGQRGPEQEKSR
jgi:cytochrome c peroxidase